MVVMPRSAAILFVLATLAPLAAAQSQGDAVFRTGLVNLQAQKFPEAEAVFRQLYASEPDNIRGLMGVIDVYMAQGKRDDALRLLEGEIARLPDRPDLLVAAGDLAMRARNYDKAIVRFGQALDSIGFKSESTFYLHRGPIGGKPLAESVNALIGPDVTPKGAAGVYLRLSEAWSQKGEHQAALEAIGHARELLPRDPVILWNAAVLLESAGQNKEALETYRAVLKVNPKNALAMNNAAYLMAETGGDLYEALRYAQRAKVLEPNILEVSDTVAWISLKLGWTDDAIGTFAGLVKSQPSNANYRAHLAAALNKRAARSPVEDELASELKKNPSSGNEQRILTLLTELDQRPK